jgi:hypothetical protein
MASSRLIRTAGTVPLLALAVVALLPALPAVADDLSGSSRAAWLLSRINHAPDGIEQGRYYQTDEFGYTSSAVVDPSNSGSQREHSPWLLLASAIVPGSGELMMGKWMQGVSLIGADAFFWYKANEAGDEGSDLEDEYYTFADAHWNEQNLVYAYDPGSIDIMRGGVGLDYFSLDEGFSSISSVDELERLTLWVSIEEDRREYYENLGKWDQFVFGWDDFRNPNAPPSGVVYSPDLTLSDLRQPWTSYNREKYRDMREKSNDAFKRQDRYRYVNIGLRLFSVLEVAWMQGLLGGHNEGFEVSGHEIRILAEPGTRGRGTLAAQVSF